MQKWITFIKCMPPLIVCCRCVDATYEFLPQLLRVCFLHSFLTEQWLLHRRDQYFLQICCTWKSFQLREEIASKCGKFPTNMSAHALHNINSDHGENSANLAIFESPARIWMNRNSELNRHVSMRSTLLFLLYLRWLQPSIQFTADDDLLGAKVPSTICMFSRLNNVLWGSGCSERFVAVSLPLHMELLRLPFKFQFHSLITNILFNLYFMVMYRACMLIEVCGKIASFPGDVDLEVVGLQKTTCTR